MGNDYFKMLEEANTLFKEKKLDEAAFAYADIVTELLLLEEEIDLAEIAMQLTINAYGRIEQPDEMGLYPHYFTVVRHMDDYQEIIDTNFLTESIAPNYGSRNTFTHESNETQITSSTVGPYPAFTISSRGPRDKMEDTHLAIEFTLCGKKVQLFAVLDGHGGVSCANYVKKHLKQKILQNLHSLDDLSISNALSEVCIELDAEWKKTFKDRSGSTLSAALIIDRDLWVFNVGDSRVVLGDRGHAIQLSEDAKPPIRKYEKELTRRGSFVRNSRADGTLDMARSIGDIEHPAVSARPTIRKFPLKDKPYTLIIACDGLWDVVGTEEVVKHCNKSTDLEKTGTSLKDIAFHHGSQDNVTIMLINL